MLFRSVKVLGYAGENAAWCAVACGDLRGYMRRDALDLRYLVATVAPADGTRTTTLYAQADAAGEVLGQVSVGDVTVLRLLDGWMQIRLPGGLDGYLHAQDAQIL